MIPPDARVDPDKFPEEHFPLYCSSCDYLLRGLPGDRCPECGQPFDRGRLLVEQYVIQQGVQNWPRTSKYAKWSLIAGMALMIAGPMPFVILRWTPTRLFDSVFALIFPLAVGAMGLGVLLSLVSVALSIHLSAVTETKGRRVFEAIDQSRDSYRRAQRLGRIVRVGAVVVALGCLAWRAGSADGRYVVREYARHPAGLLLPIGLAVGFGVIIWIAAALSKWLSRRCGGDER